MESQCDIPIKTGQRCTAPATHRWNGLNFCCECFTTYVNALLSVKQAVLDRQRDELAEALRNYSGTLRQIAEALENKRGKPQ